MSPREVAASYRLYAAYCFEAAQVALEPGHRLYLLNMAQAWTGLADFAEKCSESDLVFAPVSPVPSAQTPPKD